ncbi:MAG: FAD-dependent oxidoreductase [Chitinispirillaceae bacterium]|nr:FAD-dependent oxidoreductase [Chitinispirillaceae bacterium]
MEKVDVLVIGGSAAGIVAAVTGKTHHPDKKFLLIRKEAQVVVPCGIPYMFGSLESSDKNVIADSAVTNAGIALKIGEAVSIDRQAKVCETSDGAVINYGKLVLAIGSVPFVPGWLKGANLENVFTVPKNKVYLDDVIKKLESFKKIVTIGGGFIGVEVSDELRKKNKEVTVVEKLPNILWSAFDDVISDNAKKILENRGVTIKTGSGVKEIEGDTRVRGITLESGEFIEADAVLLSVGYVPDTDIARKAGIKLNENGFIKVDEYMRTDSPDIFAVGDCVEKRDFFTRKPSNVMLASTACAEARIAGINLFSLSTLKTFIGTIAIFSTAIGDTAFAAAGLSKRQAMEEGFDVVTGKFEGVDKHPGSLPGAKKQFVELIASRECGVILGGGVMGGVSCGELINLIGLAIQNRMTVHNILMTQIGTHPLLTAPPTAYPVIKAAESISRQIKTRKD